MKPTIAESLKFTLTAAAMVAAMAYITSAGGAVAAEPTAPNASANANSEVNPVLARKH